MSYGAATSKPPFRSRPGRPDWYSRDIAVTTAFVLRPANTGTTKRVDVLAETERPDNFSVLRRPCIPLADPGVNDAW